MRHTTCAGWLVGVVAAALAAAQAAPPEAPAPTAAPAEAAASPAPKPAGPEAVVETAEGTIVIRLLPGLAPRHVQHFVKTAKAGGYDGTTFHRVVMGGIIQGGDPFTKDPKRTADYGKGGLGLLKAEFSDRAFTRGVVAAVRRPSSVDSAGAQFFVVLTDQPALEGQYTIFGEVTQGIEVADRISLTPVEGDKAQKRVEMKVHIRE